MVTNDFDAYVEKYIEGYLFADLCTIANEVDVHKHPGNSAYLLVVAICSAAEFLGSLLREGSPVVGDRVDASHGLAHYIKYYLEPIEPNYAVLREIGPRLVRNGIAHTYATKGKVAITRVGDRSRSHLIRYSAQDILVINANYLLDDFLLSYEESVKPKIVDGGELRDRVVAHYEAIRGVYREEARAAESQVRRYLNQIDWLYPDVALGSPYEELEGNGSPILVS